MGECRDQEGSHQAGSVKDQWGLGLTGGCRDCRETEAELCCPHDTM